MVTLFSFFLLFHLPCFTLPPIHRRRRHRNSAAPPKAPLFHFFKRLFSSSSSKLTPQPPPSLPSHSSSTRSLLLNPTLKPAPIPDAADIYPCTVCGQILQSPSLLDHHCSVHHPLSELDDAENIVRIIFKTGWPDSAKPPNIHRVLKIHSSPKIISRFEEYRERVKSKAAAKPKSPAAERDERCIADGNELLRFHCTTFVCELDGGVCSRQYCSLCGIIANGFSPKMDGISTVATSYAAHASMPEDMEEEFRFMRVKRAVLICRVVAGRVGCDPCEVDKEDPGFDSLVGRGEGDEEEELLVYNPRAVLPCFVIVYTV